MDQGFELCTIIWLTFTPPKDVRIVWQGFVVRSAKGVPTDFDFVTDEAGE